VVTAFLEDRKKRTAFGKMRQGQGLDCHVQAESGMIPIRFYVRYRWAADRTLKDILPEQERDYERVNKMKSL
jgi:hypothetical protein